jgi:uncharacterized protein
MHIGLLTIQFHLRGCGSLKEKRQRLSGLKDRFGSIKNIAVCESACLDSWDRAQYSFTCVANEAKIVEASLAKIIDYCSTSLDAVITEHSLEWIY